ncbi:MAG: hypothetical protein Q3986_07585 [Akkermansia sp.]|nr:hypothetical protein [Akkermansia sp.]
MATLPDEMTSDFLSVWQDAPVFMVACGASIKVLVSRATRAFDLELGGFAPRQGIEARALTRDLPPELAVGCTVSIDRETYRVEDMARRPGMPITSLSLVQP